MHSASHRLSRAGSYHKTVLLDLGAYTHETEEEPRWRSFCVYVYSHVCIRMISEAVCPCILTCGHTQFYIYLCLPSRIPVCPCILTCGHTHMFLHLPMPSFTYTCACSCTHMQRCLCVSHSYSHSLSLSLCLLPVLQQQQQQYTQSSAIFKTYGCSVLLALLACNPCSALYYEGSSLQPVVQDASRMPKDREAPSVRLCVRTWDSHTLWPEYETVSYKGQYS